MATFMMQLYLCIVIRKALNGFKMRFDLMRLQWSFWLVTNVICKAKKLTWKQHRILLS